MNEETLAKEENKIASYIIPLLIGVLFTLIGIIYVNLGNKDAEASQAINDLKSHQASDAARFQNLEANVYLLCKSQKLDCIPPIN